MWAYWGCKWILKFQLFSCTTDRSQTTDQSICRQDCQRRSCPVSLKFKLSNLIIIMYFLACEQLSCLVSELRRWDVQTLQTLFCWSVSISLFITWNATIKWDNDSWKWEDVLKFSTRMLCGRKHYVEREWLSSEPLKGGESWKRSPSLERKGCF